MFIEDVSYVLFPFLYTFSIFFLQSRKLSRKIFVELFDTLDSIT